MPIAAVHLASKVSHFFLNVPACPPWSCLMLRETSDYPVLAEPPPRSSLVRGISRVDVPLSVAAVGLKPGASQRPWRSRE